VGAYFESPDYYGILKESPLPGAFNLTLGYSPWDDLPVLSMLHDSLKDWQVRTGEVWGGRRAYSGSR
jgi:hypothetical protein